MIRPPVATKLNREASEEYFRDHVPPHFHAIYGGYEAAVEIASGDIVAGALPPRVLRLIAEWRRRYRRELETNWDRARAHLPLQPIPPLD